MLYDELVFEDGRYLCAVDSEYVFQIMYPPDRVPCDRSKIHYFEPGESFLVQVARTKGGQYHPLMKGPTLASYQVDFYPILAEANLLGVEYIRSYPGELSEERQQVAKAQAHRDRSSRDLLNEVIGGLHARDTVIESFYLDSFLAEELRLPFSIDQRAMPLVRHENALITRIWRDDPRANVGEVWLKLGFPDFGALSWEEVQEIRTSSAGQDYRRMVNRVSRLVDTAMEEGVPPEEIVSLSQREIQHDLIVAMTRLKPSVGSLILNLALNLVPYGGVASSIKDLVEAVRYRRSWISLLTDKKD